MWFAVAVVCRAQQQQKVAAALAAVPALLAASPAFALVSSAGGTAEAQTGDLEGSCVPSLAVFMTSSCL